MHLPPDFQTIEEYAKSSCNLLIEHEKWIYEHHPYDIFRKKDLLKKDFPEDWQTYLESADLDTALDALSSLMLGMKENVEELPESFLHLCAEMRRHWLPQPKDEIRNIKVDSFKDCTKKGMGQKKLHEVRILSNYICEIASKHDLQTVIDFGSGLGYLSHEVSKKHPVIAIECDATRSESSASRTERLSKREGIKGLVDNITYVTEFLTVDNAHDVFTRNKKEDDKERYLLTGLHACGDLSASTMLDLYKSTDSIKAVISVGCCYHLMDFQKFPKSSLLKSLHLKVDKRALRLGCHTFVGFDKKRVIGLWKSQLVRAITQVEGRIILTDTNGLKENLVQIEEKHGLDHSDISLEEMESGLKNIALLSVLRCHLGPMIEGLVLMDRYLDLRKDFPDTTFLVPLFNPSISPRNHAVVSYKQDA